MPAPDRWINPSPPGCARTVLPTRDVGPARSGCGVHPAAGSAEGVGDLAAAPALLRTPRVIRHLTVPSRADLERAVCRFDAEGIPHTGVRDLGPALRLYVLVAWATDDLQVELTAPYAAAP